MRAPEAAKLAAERDDTSVLLTVPRCLISSKKVRWLGDHAAQISLQLLVVQSSVCLNWSIEKWPSKHPAHVMGIVTAKGDRVAALMQPVI
jgi:hypothetical protein